ncbi:MAG: single-stranded-DNA-specific exonuclease RecJ [Bdellovibrionaceae bacterium]|nr:single-stranded-DNA-specific exonuclease RecJ [Pseudobdellovibrionaceae bacterium]
MTRVWRSREQEAFARGLTKTQAELPDLVCRLLTARGIQDPAAIESLLKPQIQSLKDPLLMRGMREGAERLVRAFENKEKVCVYADFDLDGTSGLALLWEGLEKLGFENLVGYQPKRLSEGYGFHASVVEDLHQQGVSVIVTVDVGITAFEAAAKAKSLGIDVVLTDHHLPLEKLPDAFTVINPNQDADESGLGYLCGAGVAFYFLRALKRAMVDRGLKKDEDLPLRPLLDFLTIATLTDMVPLVDDNRALVKQGLLVLAQTQRPGLRALLDNLGLSDKPLTSQDVAIRFAPKLNALSRMETGLRPIDLFRAADVEAAGEMVHEVLENNSARVEFQSQGEARALEMLKEWPHDKFVLVTHHEFHRGVVGLIATKIAGLMNVPAFIGSRGADGLVVGSGRLPNGSELNLLDALSAVEAHMNRFGGHSGAAGFEFHSDHQELITAALVQFYNEASLRPQAVVVDYDLDVALSDLTDSNMKWIETLGPFGQGFASPLLRLSGVRVKEQKILKGGHLKLWLENLDGTFPGRKAMEALFFSPPPSLNPLSLAKGTEVEVLGELQWNVFNGQRTLQMNIKDLKMAPPSRPVDKAPEIST